LSVKLFEVMRSRSGISRSSGSNSSLKNAGFQIAAPRPPVVEDSNIITQVLFLAREGMRDAHRLQRVAGLQMVMLGGKALVMQEPKVMSEVALLLCDKEHEVSKAAYQALDFLETELSRSDPQVANDSPPGSAPPRSMATQKTRGSVSSFSSLARPFTADYGLLDRLGSFNRRLPSQQAMEALNAVILGDDALGSEASGKLASRELRKQPGLAKEVLPHLTDAVRASREAPIRKAAADALLTLASGLSKAEGCGRSVDLFTQEEAMDGLSAALRARTGKLLNELANLTPKF